MKKLLESLMNAYVLFG